MTGPPVLDLNLASRPFRNNTWLWLGYSLGVLAVVALSWWNVQTYLGARDDIERQLADQRAYETRTADLRAREKRASEGIDQVDIKRLRAQVDRANEFISLKAFSWTKLFDQLETVLPYEVRMQSIRPIFRIQDSTLGAAATDLSVPVVVEGTAQSLLAFLDLEANLLDSDAFDRVEPERHDLDPATREIVFSLRFHYYPEGRPTGSSAEVEAQASPTPAEDTAARPPAGSGRSG